MTVERIIVSNARGGPGADGAPGAQGPQGRPGYRLFATWALAAAATGAFADQAMVVTQASGTHTDPVTGNTVPNRGRYAWSVSPAGWQWIDGDVLAAQGLIIEAISPPAINTGNSQEAIRYDSPSRNEDGIASSRRMNLTVTYGPYAADALYSGQPQFTNNVVGLSWNANTAFTPIVATDGCPSIRIESKFFKASRRPGQVFMPGSEMQFAMHTVGVSGRERRSISIWQPFNEADWPYDADISFQNSAYAFADGNLVEGSPNFLVSFDWAGLADDAKPITLAPQVGLVKRGNNLAWMTQTNAAGSGQINLPWTDSTDAYQFQRNIYMSMGSVLPNGVGIQSLLTLIANDSITNGARLVYLNTNAITGAAIGFEGEVSASTRFEGLKIRNPHESGDSGGRITGNGTLYFDLFRETDYQTIGLRLKTNGDFTIGKSEQGSEVANAIVIPYATMQVQFQYPPKLPSYTVAGLPNPTTAGAGAEAFCTNETGGAVPVFSDGTNWRRGPDRNIAA